MQNNRLAIRIWDLPTRLFHWALVVCIVGAFVSVKLGGLYMDCLLYTSDAADE